MALQIRRGTEAQRTASGGVTFADGELVYITDTDSLYIGDGSTAGGILLTGNALAAIGTYLVADTINSTLDLQQDLDLNGNDIIGTGNININGTITATGNINIGDNENVDTVDFTAKITSSLTPQADTTHDIGTMSARWRNGYFTGLVVDGQVDAVSVNADVVADNSTVMVDVSANTFTGSLTGNVTGNVSGNVTGDLSGNVTGNTTGYHTGDVKGSVFGDDSSPIVDAVSNQVRATGGFIGDVTGNLNGNVKASNGTNILVAGTNGLDAQFIGVVTGNVTGNVSGNVSGNLTGNVTGNVTGNTTGYHTGDVTGSIFADDSTLLVDAVAGTIPGENISGTITANLIGDVTGNVTGNILTNSIDSADSSLIIVTPALRLEADLIADQGVTVGPGSAGPGAPGVALRPDGNVLTDRITVRNISTGDIDVEMEITSKVGFSQTTFFGQELMAGRDLRVTNFSTVVGTDHSFVVETFNGDPDDELEFEDPAFYDVQLRVNNSKADFGVPVKFPVYADASERNTAIPSPEVGMVVIVGTTMQLNTDGTTSGWVSVTTS